MSRSEINAKSPHNYIFYYFVKYTAALPGLIWMRPKILFESEAAAERIRGGAILIANHMGFFDPVYMMFAVWYRRQHFVCLKSFFEGKAGWLFRQFHCIPIDKNNFGMGSFRAIIDELKKDEVVSLFPEGKVNDGSGELAAFKSGVVLMALRSGKPIIPIYVRPKKHWYERLRVMIGEPIRVEMPAVSFQKIDAFAALLHDKEERLKELTGG
ncbi:MAG: 1-acyl-sn-glycerol-3-phosphate acyltransferase [Eubacteriales bacterium]|nr:1-acyl-sn-glycerol-3-phosphate acyltransferase [Eubacteriales bacterium]